MKHDEASMITAFALLAQYDGRVIIPLEYVCRDFFTHLTVDSFKRKVQSGDIVIPIVRLDGSQKAALGIHVEDLAAYLDERTHKARKEAAALGPKAKPGGAGI